VRARGRRSAVAGDESGFALVIVMWLFTVLFVLGAEFAGAMRQDATATKNFADETQSYYLATAAANLTFYRAFLDRDRGTRTELVAQGQAGQPGLDEVQEQGPLVHRDGEWHEVELWGAPVMVRVTDEGGKIPINFPESAYDTKLHPLLVHVLGNMGVDSETASAIADAVVDWQDGDDEHRLNGAESDYYLELPKPYIAKNARLDSLEELLLVKGVTPEMYYGGTEQFPVGLRDLFTVFNNTGEVNIRYSTPEVKRLLFGLDEEELAQIEQQVAEGQGSILQVLEGRLPVQLQGGNLVSETDQSGAILTVEAQAQLPSSRVKAHVGAVIDIEESNEGIVVFRWMDQMAVTETS
jgi:general secretion pathway protein K